jgi:colanic acid biosynthesis glycosyl transferase WcaI
MDIVVHDFSGHPFQAELARRLAERGHRVVHLSSAEYVSGKGLLERRDDDPPSLTFDQISVGRPFPKYSPTQRSRWELAYGKATAEYLRDWPGVAITCNVPLLAMARVVRAARRQRLPWVFWHQDIYSAAMGDELRRRMPRPVAAPAAAVFTRIESWCARSADHIVAIGDAFTRVYPDWGIDLDRVSVIPNWAPLADIVPTDRDTATTTSIFPDATETLRLLYAGTLGRKHNPLLLVELLRDARATGLDVTLTVVSQGEAADDLADAARADSTLPLRVVPFQPAEILSEVLGSADVLVGLLEPEATEFSIPSKVLSYMAAGRPILGLMPASNPAAADIRACGGFVADPTAEGARQGAAWLAEVGADAEQLAQIGKATRAVAEARFNPDRVTTQFEELLATISR